MGVGSGRGDGINGETGPNLILFVVLKNSFLGGG